MPINVDLSGETDRATQAHPGWGDEALSAEDVRWLEDVFMHHPPLPQDVSRYVAIRAAAKLFAQVILQHTPKCADRSAALRHVREATMTANAAIALQGRV